MKAQLAANAAEAAVIREPPILYAQEDCQGFIEQTVKRAGGSIPDYAGSNDMYRNACTNILPIGQIPLEPGMLLFIVEHDGGEPEKYKQDGLGNASHVGMYTGGIYEVVHSSQSKGKVAASTIKNGWTHAGYLRGLDYELPQGEPNQNDNPMPAYINLPVGETVKHRISPNKDSPWWNVIRGGTLIEEYGEDNGWTRVIYGGHDGYVMSKFVSKTTSEQPEQPDTEPGEPAQDVDRAALLNELKGILDRARAITNLL